MGVIDVALRTIENDGALAFLRRLYATAVRRDPIPRRVGTFNGIKAQRASVLELRRTFPNEEEHTISQIDTYVERGDRVVVVGGGWGICAMAFANQVGPEGEVIIYEGSEQFVARCRETARLNDVADRVEVNHGIVARPGNIWGDAATAEIIHPRNLPECDVLQVDCDGAELEVLRGLTIEPRTAIVEIHGMFDVAEADVDAELESHGYTIADRVVWDARFGGYVKTYTLDPSVGGA